MGESDKPIMRYSTSELAKDTLEVCSHLGWTNKRDLHVIGISMGGMVAQEMVRYFLAVCLGLVLNSRRRLSTHQTELLRSHYCHPRQNLPIR